jgi:FtsZ-interacting cell division protein ZipA
MATCLPCNIFRSITMPTQGINMNTATIVVIVVIALAALLLLVALGRNRRSQHRHAEAQTIRDQAREEDRHITQREALAEETDARARAAQAEADVKTAQAERLQQQAASRRSEVANSRDGLNERFDRADALDPATPEASDPHRTPAHDEPRPAAGPR